MTAASRVLPPSVAVGGVAAMASVVADPSVWVLVPYWAIGAAYTVGEARARRADPVQPPPARAPGAQR